MHSNSGMPVTPGQKGEQGAKLKFCLAPDENSSYDLSLRKRIQFKNPNRAKYQSNQSHFEAEKLV